MPRALPSWFLLVGLLVAFVTGCEFGSEAAFTSGAEKKTCDDSIPVCNTTAGCTMREEDSYIEGEFPGYRNFIIPTEGEAIIRILFYWRTQLGPGADTEILWHEPACVDTYSYESQGVNIFEDIGQDGTLLFEERVFRAGDHLIEIRSDATGEYILRPYVLTPDEWEAEKRSQFDPDNIDEYRPFFLDFIAPRPEGSGEEP